MSEQPPHRRRAAALRYEHGRDAVPRLVAKGTDAVADRILAIAREHSVPTHEDRALVQVLSTLKLEEEIPVELWSVVAQILLFVRRAELSARNARQG
jgi:flagellar biosynthesis protein